MAYYARAREPQGRSASPMLVQRSPCASLSVGDDNGHLPLRIETRGEIAHEVEYQLANDLDALRLAEHLATVFDVELYGRSLLAQIQKRECAFGSVA